MALAGTSCLVTSLPHAGLGPGSGLQSSLGRLRIRVRGCGGQASHRLEGGTRIVPRGPDVLPSELGPRGCAGTTPPTTHIVPSPASWGACLLLWLEVSQGPSWSTSLASLSCSPHAGAWADICPLPGHPPPASLIAAHSSFRSSFCLGTPAWSLEPVGEGEGSSHS